MRTAIILAVLGLMLGCGGARAAAPGCIPLAPLEARLAGQWGERLIGSAPLDDGPAGRRWRLYANAGTGTWTWLWTDGAFACGLVAGDGFVPVVGL